MQRVFCYRIRVVYVILCLVVLSWCPWPVSQLHDIPPIPKPTIHANNNTAELKSFPSIAWLLSFPNSGTSYTITNIYNVSQRLTATNYNLAGIARHLDPVHFPDGPYLLNLSLAMPSSYLLTKTHCASYCTHCPYSSFANTTESNFLQGCLTAKGWDDQQGNVMRRSVYPSNVVSRAVHLIRDPFDNLVARMHLSTNRYNESSRDGRLAWCKTDDKEHLKAFLQKSAIRSDVAEWMQQLPCSLEWYRWVQWHNLAHQVTRERLGIPVLYLYYEHYGTAFHETMDGMLSFLKLSAEAPPIPFVMGKTYRHLYSSHEIALATRVISALATPECWNLIRHYFVGSTASMEISK